MIRVLRAPQGKEVEECTPLEISEILKEAIEPTQIEQAISNSGSQKRDRKSKHENQVEIPDTPVESKSVNQTHYDEDPKILSAVQEVYPEINETLEAAVLDSSMKMLLKIPVSDIIRKLVTVEGGKFLVLDGIITQRLIDAADKAGLSYVVGHRTSDLKKPTEITVRTFDQLGIGN